MISKFLRLIAVAFCLLASAFAAQAQDSSHGLSLRGKLKYAAGFDHFEYVNPDAPKGGELRLAGIGTFDTVNPFTLKGVAAAGAGLLHASLMAKSMDEPFSQYGWVAESVKVSPKRDWVSYKLRSGAVFSDGSPITPEDVIFSFEVLRDKGHPSYRSYYHDVLKAEKVGADGVKFTFRNSSNTELPMIMGELPVLSKKFWGGRDFSATMLDKITGSGPYEVASFSPGRSVTYSRVKNWWAEKLPVNKGRYNFDAITYDYYRDSTVAVEAFFAGRYDFRLENIAKNWALSYDTPAVKSGMLKKQEIKNYLPSGMQAFIFNTRREVFKDRKVREALGYAFDFEWSNKNFAYGSYNRTSSYFENSEMAAQGLPSKEELALLQPYRDKLPAELFEKEFVVPKTSGNGDNRDNLRKAAELLREAGLELKNGVLLDKQGKPFTFEILEVEPAFERWTQPFLANLKRLGIEANLRMADSAQYQRRMDDFDFDVAIGVFGQSLSPGNEQRDMWGSAKANVKGSRNLIGVRDQVVDALIEKLVAAKTQEELVVACKALDRVLLWQYYVIPHWHIGAFRIAYWDKFGQPVVAPKYDIAVEDSWWIEPEKLEKLNAARSKK